VARATDLLPPNGGHAVAVKINPRKSALIIQDMQNDVISEGGAFADSGAPAHATSQRVVANVKALASAARGAGMPVIHIWYIVEKGAPGLKQNAPLFQGGQGGECARTWHLGCGSRQGSRTQEGRFHSREDENERFSRDDPRDAAQRPWR
jgi:gluconolactonase